jgi:hypothetical protein
MIEQQISSTYSLAVSAVQRTMNSSDTLSNSIKSKAHFAHSRAPSVQFNSYNSHYVTIISIILNITLNIPNFEILIWVRIHC